MHDALKVSVKEPTYAEIIGFAETTVGDILSRSAKLIDKEFAAGYAIKNPELTQHVARILFDEFAILRAHHGSRKRVLK